MNQITRALSAEQIAGVEARKGKTAIKVAVEKAPPRFVEGKGGIREMVVDLDFPVEYDGTVYSRVTIRRPTMREWASYSRSCEAAVEADGPGADDFVDMPWVDAPAIVLEYLDFVDGAKVEAAQAGFFARSALPPVGTTDPNSPQE